MTLKFPYTDSEYAEFANTATQTGKVLVKQPNGDIEMVAPAPTPEPPVTQEVLDLREKYRASTRSICALAGQPIVDKLTDVAYEPTMILAMSVDPISAGLLSQTTMYCLMQLYRLDGNNAWDRI